MATSTLVHAGIAALLVWATMAVGEEAAEEEEEITLIEVTEDVPPPPPPPPPAAEPPPPTLENVPKGFQTLTTPVIVPPDIPPPGEEIREEDFSGEGAEGGRAAGEGPPVAEVSNTYAFTPFTVKPRCTQRCGPDDILRHVPALLKRAGLSCRLTVGIRIDTQGAVTATDMLQSSGNNGCDSAAQEWARTTRWTTAYNRDVPVTVWIAQPVTISTE